MPLTDSEKYKRRLAKGKCAHCRNLTRPGKSTCKVCKDKTVSWQRERHSLRRAFLIKYYGSQCKCCGEDEYQFLMFDHINDDGAKHRRSLTGKNKVGHQLVDDLFRRIKSGRSSPYKIRLLCANCNTGRARNNGVCPHDSNS